MKFYVGQEVEYTFEKSIYKDYYTCTVEIVESEYLVARFIVKNNPYHTKGKDLGKHRFLKTHFKPAIVLSKEEHISRKCKDLWNKSKWVQKNKHLAY